ncbi:MAG: FKBP-type peptidyl-prolyl cis-trans isomerase [Bacteroidetes bacterium]|nr:MAG: FKBP-type peptidyl-prolyl cis-trans isomerase [Bacteroidota bacterium]
MKNNLILWFAALMMTATIFTSCNKATGKWQTTKDGLKYKFYEQNKEGNTPAEGDYVTVEMIYRTPDSTLFNSTKLPKPMELPMIKSVHQADIYEGLALMHEGDSATFECNADSVFHKLFRFKTVPENLKDVKSIFFDVKLVKITSKEVKMKEAQEAQKIQQEEMMKNKAEEAGKLQKYLTDNNITVAPTADSLFIVVTEKGNGPKPQKGDKVTVHYTGYLLDGTKFDSSVDRGKPFEFEIGVGRVIKGWDEGIAALNKGSKAKLIIPSKLAYGERGAGGVIPPYSPLVFDVELIDFTSGK